VSAAAEVRLLEDEDVLDDDFDEDFDDDFFVVEVCEAVVEVPTLCLVVVFFFRGFVFLVVLLPEVEDFFVLVVLVVLVGAAVVAVVVVAVAGLGIDAFGTEDDCFWPPPGIIGSILGC